ncbi:MAG: glycosyltransferase family 2 protein [Verrucomicrobiales bacterium]|jgi:glycosyltransferase involved in cell wall biosynthesis|nr:glycosyltransferase family 2 protein [Verrucomicrobiales bacterium]
MNTAAVKCSVLVNNHNYARYLPECLDSILNQSEPAHEIIVVDDGSTDDSLAVLQRYADSGRVRIIAQKNAGQFAAIATGIEAADGDVLCFLDADDSYKPNYLRELGEIYRRQPKTDMVFCRFEPVGRALNNWPWLSPEKDYDYGRTALWTYFYFKKEHECFIGSITSCVSLRRRMARLLRLGEITALRDCRLSADYSLLLGVSLLGGRKFYLARELVNYRLHETNQWNGPQKQSVDKLYRDRIQRYTAFNFYATQALIDGAARIYLDDELATVPDPLLLHVERYQGLKKYLHSKAVNQNAPAVKAPPSPSASPEPPRKAGFFRRLERSIRKRRKKWFQSGSGQ